MLKIDWKAAGAEALAWLRKNAVALAIGFVAGAVVL